MEQSPKKPFIKGYKYRIYPTDSQKQFLAEVFGANIENKAMELYATLPTSKPTTAK